MQMRSKSNARKKNMANTRIKNRVNMARVIHNCKEAILTSMGVGLRVCFSLEETAQPASCWHHELN